MDSTLHTVYFHGSLGKKYGTGAIQLYGRSTKDIFAGLCSRFGERFKQTIVDNAWHIVKGEKTQEELTEKDSYMSETEVEFTAPDIIHVYPAVIGSGGRGVGQIILGVVLIIVAVLMWWNPGGWAAIVGAGASFSGGAIATVAVAGIASLAGGLTAMLTPVPKMGAYGDTSTEKRASFLFNGPVNSNEQGVPIPLVYGRHKTGSVIISAGIEIERLR